MFKRPLTTQFRLLQRHLQVRLYLRCLAWALLCLCGGILALGLWELLFKLSEGAAALCMVLLFLASSIFSSLLSVRRTGRIATARQLALSIEKQHPELMDQLICAVELEEQNRQLNPLEASLLQSVQQKYALKPEFFSSGFQSFYPWRRSLLLMLLAFLLLLPGTRLDAFRKAKVYFRTLRGLEAAGIRIILPASEFALHSDVPIKAEILRWENQAEIEIEEQGNKRYVQAMFAQKERLHSFTIYDINAPLRFRVRSASLQSAWHKIEVYEQPALEALSIRSIPLPYTKNKVQSFSEFTDFSLCEGEQFEIIMQMPSGIEARMQASPELPNIVRGDRMLLLADQSRSYQVILQDQNAHQSKCQPFQVSVEPDLPPVLEVKQPKLDSNIKPGDSILLDLLARDDYGLQEIKLQFSLSGGERQFLQLYKLEDKNDAEKELQYREFWELEKMDLQPGDLLSGMIIVSDNREPSAQHTRSELFFITVKPEADELEAEGDMPGKEMQADISDLLAESKRLLRLTWENLGLAGSLRAEELQKRNFELLRDLHQLEVELRQRLNQLQELSQGLMAEPLPSLFQRSSQFMLAAAALLERELLEESLQPQEQALAALVQIENEMLQNAIKSKGEQGSEDSEGEGENEGQDQEQQNNAEKQQQELADLRENLQQLENLLQRQEQLNQEAAQGSSLPEDLAQNQRQIRSDSLELEQALQELPNCEGAAASLQQAAAEMDKGSSAFSQSEIQRGGIHGQRAQQQLLQAQRQLQQNLRQSSANQIKQLADQGAEMAEKQAEAAAASAEAAEKKNDVDRQKLREEQNQLRQQYAELQQNIDELANLLNEDYPEASQALREAAARTAQQGLDKKMQRASNALLYKQFQAASQEQKQTANHLQALAQDLDNSAQLLPPFSSEELREKLKQLQKMAEQMQQDEGQTETQGKQAQKSRQAREQAAQMLQEIAEPLQDQRLQNIADELNAPGAEHSQASQNHARAQALLRAAGSILQEHLLQMLRDDKINFSRESTSPPRKYRRQVEKYFKELSK